VFALTCGVIVGPNARTGWNVFRFAIYKPVKVRKIDGNSPCLRFVQGIDNIHVSIDCGYISSCLSFDTLSKSGRESVAESTISMRLRDLFAIGLLLPWFI
jgi:hypothetical protein